jgi:GNAT superfamily N-acetyltransferase
MHIESITVADFFAHPDAPALLDAYARECANEGLPAYNPHLDTYGLIEASGALQLLAAVDATGRMLGFLALLVSLNPHYSVLLAVTESWFVAPEHRATGAGLALYRTAKDAAKARGALAIYVSAPAGGQLAGVMAGLGAAETNRVFCEVLA